MIISLEKKEDIELLGTYLGILEIAAQQYQKTQDEKYLPYIEQFRNACDELNKKIQSEDYTERDERRKRIDAQLEKYAH